MLFGRNRLQNRLLSHEGARIEHRHLPFSLPCKFAKKKRESSLSQGMLLHQMLMTPAITINLKLRLTSICKNLKGVGGDGNSKVFCGHCTLVVLGSSASREGVCENATCTSKEPKWRESRRRSSNKQRALLANWWHMQ